MEGICIRALFCLFMKTYTLKSNPLQSFPTIQKLINSASHSNRALRFHFGLDTELVGAVVCVIVDQGNPRDLGRRSREEIVALAASLTSLGHSVSVSQESCGFGPYLHRQLLAAGAVSYLVAPENLNGKRKTDRTDARKLACQLVDFEVHGNKKAMRPIRDLEESDRMRRSQGRQRYQLLKARNQLAGNGRGLLHEFGWYQVPEGWWGRRKWSKLEKELRESDRDWLIGMLQPLVDSIFLLHDRCRELETNLEATRECKSGCKRVVPEGIGELTMDILECEVGDWTRFRNRQQVGSFTGLCSGENSSSTTRRQGGIDRMGNHRIRHQLVEAVWRLQQWNPGWRGFAKFPHVFGETAKAGPATRKKAIVACARLLMIDLWRLNTGQTELENLGLIAA